MKFFKALKGPTKTTKFSRIGYDSKALELSTAHLSEAFAKWLDDHPSNSYVWPMRGFAYSDGFLFLLQDPDAVLLWVQDHKKGDELLPIVNVAYDSGFSYLVFDRDNDTHPDFETYTW